jgi:hypothetical protein
MFSASSEARDRTNPISPHEISLQRSHIEQKFQPIRCLKPIALGLRQGQDRRCIPWPIAPSLACGFDQPLDLSLG